MLSARIAARSDVKLAVALHHHHHHHQPSRMLHRVRRAKEGVGRDGLQRPGLRHYDLVIHLLLLLLLYGLPNSQNRGAFGGGRKRGNFSLLQPSKVTFTSVAGSNQNM